MSVYGYARVSTAGQTLEGQLEALRAAGLLMAAEFRAAAHMPRDRDAAKLRDRAARHFEWLLRRKTPSPAP